MVSQCRRETIGSALGCPASYMKGLDPNLFLAVCTQAMTLYKPKLFWKEATGETGQEDQTKEGMSMRDELEDITDHERVDFHSLFGDIFLQA